ncbi:MAG: hypothetical protein LBG24_02180 [Treponema sp.]|nr:hypothetical protein [Treponema sp.]
MLKLFGPGSLGGVKSLKEQMPILTRPYAGTGRIPYQDTSCIRSFPTKRYFGIEKARRLIRRLKGGGASDTGRR